MVSQTGNSVAFTNQYKRIQRERLQRMNIAVLDGRTIQKLDMVFQFNNEKFLIFEH